MLLIILAPALILAAMAVGFRQPVGLYRTAEALLPALLALLPIGIWVGLEPNSESAAWFPLLALAMSAGFWVLAVLSLSGRQWPRQSAPSQAASITVWILAVVFGVLQASRFLPDFDIFSVARFSYAPLSLFITAVFFMVFWGYFRSSGVKARP